MEGLGRQENLQSERLEDGEEDVWPPRKDARGDESHDLTNCCGVNRALTSNFHLYLLDLFCYSLGREDKIEGFVN